MLIYIYHMFLSAANDLLTGVQTCDYIEYIYIDR